MTDIYLRQGQANPNNIALTNPIEVRIAAIGVSATCAVGTASVTGGATATATGVAATAAIGTTTHTGTALKAVTGVAATAAIGTVSVAGSSLTAVAGVATTAAIGTTTQTGTALTAVAGVATAAAIGTTTHTGSALINSAGVAAVSAVGEVLAEGDPVAEITWSDDGTWRHYRGRSTTEPDDAHVVNGRAVVRGCPMLRSRIGRVTATGTTNEDEEAYLLGLLDLEEMAA